MVTTANALKVPDKAPTQQLASALGGQALSDANTRSLRQALAVIRGTRADLNSNDPKVAAAAKSRLGLALHYVVGFIDGSGFESASPDPGFAKIFAPGLAQSDFPAALDDIDKGLSEVMDPARVLTAPILIPLGAVVAAVGVALKFLGDALKGG